MTTGTERSSVLGGRRKEKVRSERVAVEHSKLVRQPQVMASAPDVLLHRLQSVLNAAVQLVFSARRSDHTTPLLCELHWLKVPEC